MKIIYSGSKIQFLISRKSFDGVKYFFKKNSVFLFGLVLCAISVFSYIFYYNNGLGLAYNDARSHLDIGRRVVEGLNTGLAQLGSVWLPLPHILMLPTVWSDFMWHSGLAGAIPSMIAFLATSVLIYFFLKEIGVGIFARLIGVSVFVANINILYLQSTAMTELILLGTMTAGAYYFLLWYKRKELLYIIYTAFWIMLSTLIRYDGWFLFFFAAIFIFAYVWRIYGYKAAEGHLILFCTLGGFGIALWFLWNLMIFKDALYFIYGPFSAYTQQRQLEEAGVLFTKKDLLLSAEIYLYALAYNSSALTMILGFAGAIVLWLNKRIPLGIRLATVILIAPLIFNIIALYFGHSVLFISGLSGDTWFNVRYGIMMMPSFAIFIGYLMHRVGRMRTVLASFLVFVAFFSFANGDAVTIDDARYGSSQKNVTEVSSWLRENTKDKAGYVLISVASHDSIIFTSGLPMKKFIHEGAGDYYKSALENPDRWARWIVMRTNSNDDSTWREVNGKLGFKYFDLMKHYPFADIYELKDEYVSGLIKDPVFVQK